MNAESSGAFTGENSACVLAELGGTYCLVGHSERRVLFGESDSSVAMKIRLCQASGITPILCVGESQEERKLGLTRAVIESQIAKGLRLAQPKLPLMVAYEPIWAVGADSTAGLEDIDSAREVIVACLHQHFSSSAKTRIIYGGSVNERSCAEIMSVAGISGVLVGRASTDASQLMRVVSRIC